MVEEYMGRNRLLTIDVRTVFWPGALVLLKQVTPRSLTPICMRTICIWQLHAQELYDIPYYDGD